MAATQKSKRFVLILLSNFDDRFRASMLFQQFGINICTANSASEAIEFMNVATPDGILTEAGPTSLGLLSKIKAEPRFSGVPVIFLTRSYDRVLEDKLKHGEIAACMRNPINVEEFHTVIQSVFEKVQRQFIRIATNLRAKMEDNSEGLVTVLSEYGMFFRTLDPRPQNSRLPMTLDIEGRSIALDAVVLYTSSFDEGPFREPGMGLKFVKIAPDDRAFIKAFILEQIESSVAR